MTMKLIMPWPRLRFVVALAAGLAAFFFVPFLVTEQGGTSESAMYGYSNRIALIALAVFASAGVVWQKGFGLTFPERRQGVAGGLSLGLLWGSSLLSAGLATAVWLAARPGISFQEAPYFLDRYAMYGMGQHLYRDIDWSYGPLMFYLPVAFARVTSLNLVDAFFVTWILQWFAGVVVLWKVIDLAVKSTGHRHGRAIFILLWAVTVMDVFAAGPNYTPLRFGSGLLLALLTWRLFVSRKSVVPASIFGAIGSVLLALYSPEQGLALALASVVFFALNATRGRSYPLAAALFLTILGAGLVWADSLGEFAMVRAVSSGALHVPIFLSAQNLAFVLVLLVTASAAWNAIRMHRTNNPMLYLALISAASLPAAFGQANPGHMFYNLLGAMVVALIVLGKDRSGSPTRTWRVTKICFLLVFVLATAVEHAFMDHAAMTIPARRWIVANGNRDSLLRCAYVAVMSRAVSSAEMQTRLGQMDADARSATAPQAALYDLAPGTTVMAPFGIDRPAHQEVGGLRIFTGRYPWLLPILNPHETSDKIAELEAHPSLPLLIPDVSDGSACRYNLQVLRQRTWQNFLPFYIPPVRQIMTDGDRLCAYINANYRRSSTADPGKPAIWLPIAPPAHPGSMKLPSRSRTSDPSPD